jgi:non-canonical purine NTP pyrophosphatase (RdgB/HAM1 family)
MLTFVTGNKDKASEIGQQLGYPIAHASLDLYEIQSLDMREIIEAKAREAYRILATPVLVDDASVEIESLHGLPGPLIKWFLKTVGNEGICNLTALGNRKAVATVAIGYFDGKDFIAFISSVNGTISDKPKGSGGYGWDAIFIQEGYSVTRSELSPDEYVRASIRKPALDSLKEYLDMHSH